MRRLVLLCVVAAMALLGACSSDDDDRTAADASATLSLSEVGSFGDVLVDADGRTLYSFAGDEGTTSHCADSCAELWPPVESSDDASVGSGLSADDLGSTTREDGSKQVTYAGHPLYRYSKDAKPGDANGQGVGSTWYVVDADGAPVTSVSADPSY